MYRVRQSYLVACVIALVTGFSTGIAIIPDRLFREDQFWNRTMVTYFYTKGAARPEQLAAGWSEPHEDGTWSTGGQSTLVIDLDKSSAKDIELEFAFFPFFAKNHQSQTINVTVNRKPVASWSLKGGKPEQIKSVRVEKSLWDADHPKKIAFEFAEAPSPKEPGIGSGKDQLGIRLSSLVIREQP